MLDVYFVINRSISNTLRAECKSTEEVRLLSLLIAEISRCGSGLVNAMDGVGRKASSTTAASLVFTLSTVSELSEFGNTLS